ncbi:MAG: LysR family transcriptional regulator [Betaproteobacteria bacterium]|nr:LysR family transcriptional regulator [Betaproteobacteria bacterium]
MRYNGLDLNLIVALDAVLEEASVTKAAERLNLTQPALSSALARLREYFGDELLVQVGRRMVPTPYAQSLRPLAARMLREAQLLVASSSGFDPATSKRRFRISASDYIVTVLITPLMARFATIAPGVGLDIVPTGPQLLEQLDRGSIDCVISPEDFLVHSHPSEVLFEDQHVIVGWAGNPALSGEVNLDTLLELGHVATSIGAGAIPSFARQQMRLYRERLKIEATVPNFSAIPAMLIGSHRVSILQARLARFFSATMPIVIKPLPFDMPPLREVAQYHSTRVNDVGLRWLVDRLKDVAAASGDANDLDR